jgi:hypothetical protein
MSAHEVLFWKVVCGLLVVGCARAHCTGFVALSAIAYYLLLAQNEPLEPFSRDAVVSARHSTSEPEPSASPAATFSEKQPEPSASPAATFSEKQQPEPSAFPAATFSEKRKEYKTHLDRLFVALYEERNGPKETESFLPRQS